MTDTATSSRPRPPRALATHQPRIGAWLAAARGGLFRFEVSTRSQNGNRPGGTHPVSEDQPMTTATANRESAPPAGALTPLLDAGDVAALFGIARNTVLD